MKNLSSGAFNLFIGFKKQGEYFPVGRRFVSASKGFLSFVGRPPDDNPIGQKYYDHLVAEFPGTGPFEKQKVLNVLTGFTGCPIGARLNLNLLCREGFIKEIPAIAAAPELVIA